MTVVVGFFTALVCHQALPFLTTTTSTPLSATSTPTPSTTIGENGSDYAVCTKPVLNFQNIPSYNQLCKHNRIFKAPMLRTNLGSSAKVCNDNETQDFTRQLQASLQNGLFGGADGDDRDCNSFCVFNLVDHTDEPSHFRWSRLSQCWKKQIGHTCKGAASSEIEYAQSKLSNNFCPVSSTMLSMKTTFDVTNAMYDDNQYGNDQINNTVSESIVSVSESWTISVKTNASKIKYSIDEESPTKSKVSYLSNSQLW